MSDTRSILFYAATIAFAAGIFIRSFFVYGLPVIVWLLLIAFVSALLYVRTRQSALLLLSVALSFGALGMLRMEWASWGEAHPLFESNLGQEVTYEGVVAREPEERERTTHVYVLVHDELLLLYADVFTEVAYGDRVEVTGMLKRPESFVTDLGRTFNYPGYLRARGVHYVVSFAEVRVIGKGEGNILVVWLLRWKHTFMQSLERALLPASAGLGEGLLLGVKRGLGEEMETAFRQSGIIHIVVLSGYNIMLVVAFVLYGLSFFVGMKGRIVFGLCAILAFAATVGFSATVLRASVMAGLSLFLKLSSYSYLVVRGLFLAGFVMILWNPYLLAFDVGFQLSFLATYGLITLASEVDRFVAWMPNLFSTQTFLSATIATQLFVLPLLLFQMGEVSLVSVIVNVLVLPMVPIAMLLTFATGLVGLLSGTLVLPIALLAHLSLMYIIVIAQWFASLPYASLIVPVFPWWGILCGYAALGLLMWYRLRQRAILQNKLYGWTIEEELDNGTDVFTPFLPPRSS